MDPNSRYRIVFTPLASAFAARRSSVAALEERVRGEIAELMSDEEGLMAISELCFHTIEVDGDPAFICFPQDEGGETVLVVDTCSMDEQVIDVSKGPLAGQKIFVPTADSD